MSPWQRDVIALLGLAFLAIGAYLIHPALAFLLIGGALLSLVYFLVPPAPPVKDEADDGSGLSS